MPALGQPLADAVRVEGVTARQLRDVVALPEFTDANDARGAELRQVGLCPEDERAWLRGLDVHVIIGLGGFFALRCEHHDQHNRVTEAK
eukprot:CAMPEP_0117531784 /NCGR_PEP_ID=MMETSP0784-20121206/39036_1 /TAXON_ID=39447 /ORGANISM="" /LENGTH=88 /DNA_ID=CAMNT_0005328167 /DNA_START=330 /DNA_END=596 /DNA_ORIENTATION=+